MMTKEMLHRLIDYTINRIFLNLFKLFQLCCTGLILVLIAPILLLDAIDIALYVVRLIDYCIRHIGYYRQLSSYDSWIKVSPTT